MNIANQLNGNALPSLLSAINNLSPNFLELPVTLSDALAVRDEIKNGNFPAYEQLALTAWAVTPDEIAALEQGYGNIPDTVLQSFFQQFTPVNGNSIALGDALNEGTAVCSTCLRSVPEPTSKLSLLTLNILGAASILNRKFKLINLKRDRKSRLKNS